MKNVKKDSKQEQKPKGNKKPYARPEVSKHGNVESLTQLIGNGPSCPILVNY